MPPNPNPYKPFGEELVLAVELMITYVDGTIEVIHADEISCKEHPVVMSNVYGSETIDGRRIRMDGVQQSSIRQVGRMLRLLQRRKSRLVR